MNNHPTLDANLKKSDKKPDANVLRRQSSQVAPLMTNHEIYEYQQQVRQRKQLIAAREVGQQEGIILNEKITKPQEIENSPEGEPSCLIQTERKTSLFEGTSLGRQLSQRASRMRRSLLKRKLENQQTGDFLSQQQQQELFYQQKQQQQQAIQNASFQNLPHLRSINNGNSVASTSNTVKPNRSNDVSTNNGNSTASNDQTKQMLNASSNAVGDEIALHMAKHSAYHPHFTGYDINSAAPSDSANICSYFLTGLSLLLVLITLPISLFLCIKVVQEYERVVIFRLGRLLKGGARGPGIFFIIPCIDTYCIVDLRTVSFDVPPQEILSKDSVTVAVDAVVYYRISNATIAVSNVENYGRSTRLLAATTLRNVLGTKNLSEILSEREAISHIMQLSLDEATEPWGVKVERVEIKDVRLPVQLQRVMASEAEAAREAKAKFIYAEGEQKASKALRNAAEVIAMSPQALQLRYLQTLHSIAAEKCSTIVFPIPLEMFAGFRNCMQSATPVTNQPTQDMHLQQGLVTAQQVANQSSVSTQTAVGVQPNEPTSNANL